MNENTNKLDALVAQNEAQIKQRGQAQSSFDNMNNLLEVQVKQLADTTQNKQLEGILKAVIQSTKSVEEKNNVIADNFNNAIAVLSEKLDNINNKNTESVDDGGFGFKKFLENILEPKFIQLAGKEQENLNNMIQSIDDNKIELDSNIKESIYSISERLEQQSQNTQLQIAGALDKINKLEKSAKVATTIKPSLDNVVNDNKITKINSTIKDIESKLNDMMIASGAAKAKNNKTGSSNKDAIKIFNGIIDSKIESLEKKINNIDIPKKKMDGGKSTVSLGYSRTPSLDWEPSEKVEINTIKFYQGNVYKNLTGTNTDDNPENDTTNWDVVTGGGGGVQAGFTQKFSVFSTDNLILFSVYEKGTEWKVQKTTSDSDTETALQTTTAPNESDADILTTLQNLTYI